MYNTRFLKKCVKEQNKNYVYLFFYTIERFKK